MQGLIDFTDLVGADNYFTGDRIEERYKVDIANWYRSEPLCVVRPKSTAEVVEIVNRASAASTPIVPLGGNSGMSGGTVANGSIKLSLERLNKIHEIDPASMTITVGAGLTLQAAQEAAEDHGMMFPLDLGSRGSATIGGVLATNAGGSRVFRWGMARDMALGLEAVMADGSIVTSLGKMIKDNAGYNWKQLLIGSEGTLGIITKAVLRLRPKPASTQTALLSMKNFDSAIRTLRRLEADLSGQLSSFELMWDNFYNFVTTANLSKRARPLPLGQRIYCLVEATGNRPDEDQAAFESALANLLKEGIAADAVIAQSERERQSIWAVREDLMEVVGSLRPVGFDISMSQSVMEEFQKKTDETIKSLFPEATAIYYGHIGDGNLHIMVMSTREDHQFHEKLEIAVYKVLQTFGGSIAGEHGIGIAKPEFLHFTRTANEIALMRRIKDALDPHHILNPGKVLS